MERPSWDMVKRHQDTLMELLQDIDDRLASFITSPGQPSPPVCHLYFEPCACIAAFAEFVCRSIDSLKLVHYLPVVDWNSYVIRCVDMVTMCALHVTYSLVY